ncbi:MAG: universal stress protein [Chlamydiales bacterium]|nr:universal stress protein [Chlamydiales bacterium]
MGKQSAASKKTTVARIDKGSLRRILSVADLFAIGYGDLGSSIYYALGITALYALGATPIALMLAGLVFACTALTYAEMSSVMHEAGGSASYSRKAFNDLISFIAGWALMLDYIVTIAISSYSIAPYLSYFFPILNLTFCKIAFTILIVFVLFILNTIAVKSSTRLSVVLTALTIITQTIVIIIGLITLFKLPAFISHLQINGIDKLWSPSWKDFIKGVAMAMVAYTGIESMAQLSAEAKNPSKTVPKAILLAMTMLILMYFGISTVALAAVNPQLLSTLYLEDPLAGIVEKLPFGSAILSPWIGLLGAVLLFVAANAGLIGASRLSFNMGEYYQLPKLFYRLHPRFKTPFVALGIFAILASVIVVWSRGSLSFLANLYNFGAMLAFFSAHIALIVHRIRFSKVERPFKIPFSLKIKGYEIPISAIIGALATITVWVIVVITKADGRYLGLGWLMLGLIMYGFYRRKEQLDITGSIQIEKIKIEEFKHLEIKKILVPTRGGLQTEAVQIACLVAKLFGAEVKALNILEIPFSFPLNTRLVDREEKAHAALKRAEAIAREIGVPIQLEIVYSRSIDRAIIEKARAEDIDLVILGASEEGVISSSNSVNDQVLKEMSCRVWICKNKR